MSLRGGPSVLLGDDRAVLERAGSHQAADGGLIDGEAPGEIGLRFALCDPLQRLGALMGRELARPAEADAALWARLRPSPVLARIRWRSNSAKPPRMVSRSARRSRWVTTRTSPVNRNQQPVQFQTARQCGARTKSGKPCRSPGAVDCTAAQEVAVPLLASAMGNIVTASGPRARLRSGGNSARC